MSRHFYPSKLIPSLILFSTPLFLSPFFLSSSILFYRFTFSFIHHLHVKFADQSQDFADEKLDILMNALHIAKHPDERELGKYDFKNDPQIKSVRKEKE